MEVVIDFQGFKRVYNEFVFKEVAIIPLGENVQPIVYLFAPPHDWNLLPPRYKCENSWLTKNFHGLHWQEGEIPYEELEEILKASTRSASQIYVKGLEKQRWLKNFLPNVKNIESLDCPSLSKLNRYINHPCTNHNLKICENSNCAARNAVVLKKWLVDYFNGPISTLYKEHDYDEVDDD